MNYLSHNFLKQHSQSILNFYTPRITDNNGGYFQNFHDDGTLFLEDEKHLVSSTRIIVNYALAAIAFDDDNYAKIAEHGLNYLEKVHWQPKSESYAWTIKNNAPSDISQQAYGYAFILLAYAAARKASIITDDDKLIETYKLLEKKFWQSKYGLYADEINSEGVLTDYRGQNANMHLCEAMISAYEATQNILFLNRATLLAYNITVRQAEQTDGLIWEHFNKNFEIDWDYNKNDPKNLYRPWGFQPGHQIEWAKLLLILNRYSPNEWLVKRAINLYERSYKISWDSIYGGLIYGFDSKEKWCDDDKYFWVQAEALATVGLLYLTTNETHYFEQYQSIWKYCSEHFIDHEHGAWFRLLSRKNIKYTKEKSTAGAKCDYHTLGACFELMRTLNAKYDHTT